MKSKEHQIYIIGLILLLTVQAQLLNESQSENRFWRNAQRALCGSASIAPNEISPFMKSHLSFNGINSPQDVTKIELFNSITTIQLDIVQVYSDSLLGMLNRGNSGIYKGRITFKNGYYIETNNNISIQAKINSIYPSIGNYLGGVLLTVQGQGFGLQDSDSEILIGEAQCAILSYSYNQIQCITQPAWKLLNQKRNVVLKRKNIVSLTKNATNTEFTFVEIQNQPKISRVYSKDSQFTIGSTVFVEGTNLFANGFQTQLLIRSSSVTFQKTSEGLSFVVPEISPNLVQDLVVLVDQNGSTDPQPFQVSNKIYCLNPDNSLYLQDGYSVQLLAKLYGVSEQSQVQIIYDNQKPQTKADIISQGYIYKYDQVPQIPTQILNITIDRQNILQNPIKLIQSVQNVQVFLNITNHPSDEGYFQIKLISDQSTQNIVIQNLLILIPSINFIDDLIQEGPNTFKYKKLSQQFNYVQFYTCTNIGSARIILSNTSNLFQIDQIQMLTNNTQPKTGDIFQFKIPSIKRNQIYCMKVSCLNGYYYKDYYGKQFDQKDSYFVYPFQQNQTIYSYRFPTITQRLKSYKDTCDISVEIINPNSLPKNYFNDRLYLDSLYTTFMKEPNNDPQSYLEGIGSQIISQNLSVFKDAVTPQKQRIYVQSILPKIISAFGQEKITITGNNFLSNNNTIATTSVKLLGVDCEIQSLTNTDIICISRVKTDYNPLDLSSVSIGNEQALMLDDVKLTLELNEKNYSKLSNQFIDQIVLYIPYHLILNLDVGLYQGNDIYFNKIQIDGQLILNSSRDLNITFELISSQIQKRGILSFGTVQKRFIANCNIKIMQNQPSADLYAYGQDVGNYYYSLAKSTQNQSKVIEVQESKVYLKKGNRIMILATSLEEQNEEFIVEEVKYNKIKLSAPISKSHQNTVQKTQLQNNSTFQYSIYVPVIQTDRNLMIKGKNLQFKQLYDARADSQDDYSQFSSLVNSYIAIPYSYLNFQNVTSSVIQLTKYNSGYIFAPEILNSFFLIPNNLAMIQLVTDKFNNNFVQGGISFGNPNGANSNKQNKTVEFINNTLVASQTCINIKFPLSIKMSSNICQSFQYFTEFLYIHSILSDGIAFAALDIRQALVQYQYKNFDQYFEGSTYVIQPYKSSDTKFLVVANRAESNIQNSPVLFQNDIPMYNYTLSNFYNFEIQGLNQINFAIQYQNAKPDISQSFISVIDFYNFRSDIPKNAVFFNNTIQDSQKGIVLVDRDGSLTGKPQSIISSNFASSDLGCSTNEQNLKSCSPLIGLMTIQCVNTSGSYMCYQQQTNDFAVIFKDQQYTPGVSQINNAQVTLLQQTTSFKFVKKLTGEEFIPYFFAIETKYLSNGDLGFVAKYNFDTTKLQSVKVYLYDKQQELQNPASYQLDSTNCKQGQYYIQPDGIQFCVKYLNGLLYKYQVFLTVKN